MAFDKRGSSKEKDPMKNDLQEKFSLHIDRSLDKNIDTLKKMLADPDDLKIRTLKLGKANVPCAIVYIEGIVDAKTVQLAILNNLENIERMPKEPKKIFEYIYNKLIAVNDVKIGKSL